MAPTTDTADHSNTSIQIILLHSTPTLHSYPVWNTHGIFRSLKIMANDYRKLIIRRIHPVSCTVK